MNTKYIKQAGTFGPFLQVPPCYAMTFGMKKFFGNLYFSKLSIFYSQNYGACYYSLDEAKRVGDYYLEKVTRNAEFIGNEYKNWLRDLQKLEEAGKKLLTERDDQDFKRFYNLFIELWARSIFVEVYDEDIVERILELGKKHNVGISPKEIIALTQPQYVSIQLNFEKELVEALLRREDVNKITQKYYFLDVDYLTAYPANIQKRIKEIKRRGIEQEAKRIEMLIDKVNKDYQEKQELFKAKKIPQELRRILDFFALTIEWRDLRKKMHQIGGYYLWKYVMKKIKVAKILRPYILVQDYFQKAYLDKDYIEILQKRKKRYLVLIDAKGKINLIYNQSEIDKLIAGLEQQEEKVLSELKGNVANKGLVQGRVKVIKSSQDFPKMKKGDILVAPMTRPEYVPVIKLASAIITDEGGITCHAAIISRELGIPCIVGTKIATQVLKDGNEVEVNANHGIVKILK